MDIFLNIYYIFCNPLNPEDFNRKKEDDFKAQNHKQILDLVNSHPLEVLQTLNKSEIDQLAKKFSDLIRYSLFTYPGCDEFNLEVQLIEKRIAKSNYKLSERFRSSFKYYTKDLHNANTKNEVVRGSRSYMQLIYILYPIYS